MKKENGKKSKLWIWLVAILAVLLIGGGVTAALMLGGQQPQEEQPVTDPALRAELYWNVDRVQFTENSETGLSTRVAAEDGQFHVRFAYNGELVDLVAVDKKVVNIIDTLDVMGLTFDADGRIVSVIQPLTIATEIGKRVYVQYVEGDTIVTNSSLAMNGMEMPIKVTDLTGIYEVDVTSEKLGQALQPADLKPFDCITIYANANGDNTHIYVNSHAKSSKMYFRTEQWYNSSEQKTTREPDEDGIYSIDFFCDGELVTLHTKDPELLRKIDSLYYHNAYTGLTFDENGLFDGVMDVAVGLGGMRNVYCMEVDTVEGRTANLINVYNSNGPSEQTVTLPESCPIYDLSMAAEAEGRRGKPVDMVVPGDRLTVWSDMQGNPILAIITLHRVDMKPYYSPSRKYNSVTHETTRVPDANGYYTISLVAEGEGQKNYRIKDKDIATFIDSYAERTVGIVTEGDVIVRAYDYESIFGYTRFCTALWVDSINGSIISASTGNGANVYNSIMSPNCKVIDVTDTTTPGAKTELRVGDRIIAFRDTTKEICYIWTAGRTYEESEFYVNVSRKYDSTKKETTRTPDADGYYVFDMASRGKQVTVKTKSKDLASKIDSYGVRVMGMVVRNGIAQQAYYGGHVTGGWIDLYNGVVTEPPYNNLIPYHNEGKPEEAFEYGMIDGYECYNISGAVDSFVGEKSTPKVGDSIMIYNNRADKGVVVFILKRPLHNGLYWNEEPMYNSTTAKTARIPNEEGFYVFNMSYQGKMVTLKTKDEKIASAVDSYSNGMVLNLKGDIILSVTSYGSSKDATTVKFGGWDVASISGNNVNLKFNRFSPIADDTESFNMSGAKVYDMSPTAEVFGQETKLQVGDRVRVHANADGKVTYIYITVRNATKTAFCSHCEKEVFWNPWTGSSFDALSGHYYVVTDKTIYSQLSCSNASAELEAVLDLNGKTITRNGGGRMFLVNNADTLTIFDSVGGGTIQGMGGDGSLGNIALVTAGSTMNLLSGTLKNIGTEEEASARGGVIYVYDDNSVFNMYGGEIIGGLCKTNEKYTTTYGSLYIYKGTFNMFGGTVTGGKATLGGNVYLADKSKFNMTGGIITGGEAETNGGNIYASSNTIVNISGGEITGGLSHNTAGNLFLSTNSVTTVSGGLIDGGIALAKEATETEKATTTYGGNVYMHDATLNVEGGTISGGNATRAGNINIGGTNSVLNIKGGVITAGKATQGGNIRIASASEINMTGGTVSAGVTTNTGGNFFLGYDAKLNISGGEIVDGGIPEAGKSTTCNYGGNIYVYGNDVIISMSGGKIANGFGKNNGPSICLSTADGKGAKFTMTGGTIDGGMLVSKESVLSVSGASKIGNRKDGLNLMSGTKLVLGDLAEGAEIYVTANGVFTEPNPKAAEYLAAGYVKSANSYITITEADGVLVANAPETTAYNEVYEKAKEMDFSEGGAIEATCPYCGVSATWEPLPVLTEEKLVLDAKAHYYLDANVSYDFQAYANAFYEIDLKATICLNLNGQTLTSGNRTFFPRIGTTLNVMGEGTIQGAGAGVHKNFNGGAFDMLGATVNLCGGTYKTTGATPIISTRSEYKSTLNIYEGTTIQGAATNTISSLYLFGAATVNMYGGTIADGVAEGNYGGNVNMSDAYATEFNLYGGSVIGGTSNQGGNFRVAEGKLNVYGGSIQGGNSTNTGGNVFLLVGATLNMEGGTVEGGKAATNGGNVYVYGANTVKLSNGAQILTGTSKNNGGKNIYFQKVGDEIATFTMDGGRVENSVYVGSATKVELSGAAVIGSGNGGLYVEEGNMLTLGELTEGAEICVTATGVFTNANPKAAEYLAAGYVRGALATIKIAEQDGVLIATKISTMDAYNGVYEEAKKMTEDQVFASNETVKAACPYCGSTVTWQPLPALTEEKLVINQSGHYYLASNVSYDSQNSTEAYYELDEKAAVCLHLNGQTLTSGNRAFFPRIGTTLNVMGEGTVQGAGAGVHKNFNGGAFDMLGATVNLCGGTYKTTGATPIVSTRSEYKSTLNIYEGTTIQGAATNTISSVYLFGEAAVNMFGGTIADGVAEGNYGGNVYFSDKYNYVFNMYGGTVSGGTSAQGGNFRLAKGELNVYGGTIEGGEGSTNGGNVFLFGGATLNMEGGAIKDGAAPGGSGGNVYVYGAGNVKLSGEATISGATSKNGGGKNIYFQKVGDEVSTFTMNGGSVANSVMIGVNTVTELSGAPTIGAANGGLYIVEGGKLTLKDLLDGTEIYVTAFGAFTNVNAEAANYLEAGYIKGATAKVILTEQDGVLYAEEMTQEEIFANAYEAAKKMTADEVFASNAAVVAKCPVCYTNVTWQPLPALGNEKLVINQSGHYYLASNVSYDTQDNSDVYYELDAKAAVCLHLNGQTITSGNRAFAVRQDCVLNVMGDGTVQGAGAGAHKNFNGGAFDLLKGNLNLMGGTYKTTGATPIISTRGSADTHISNINIYNGTTIQGAATNTISSLYLYGSAVVNMYGGEIKDGVAEGNYGGNVHMADKFSVIFNLYDGIVSGGTSGQGGNFRLVAGNELNVYGGTITGGTAANGGNILLASDAVLDIQGGTVEKGNASTGSGGNVYVYGAGTVKLSGDGVITDASAKNGGGKNIYFQKSGDEVSALVMDGGKVANSVFASANTTIELSGAPTIGAGNGGLYMAEGAKIVLGELTDGTEIFVTVVAKGAISETSDKAADYLNAKYFKPTGSNVILSVVGDALYGEVLSETELRNRIAEEADAMADKFASNAATVEATCPYCDETVTWEVLPALGDEIMQITADKHYYLASNVSYDSSAKAAVYYELRDEAAVCLYLNGQTMNSGNRAFSVRQNCTLNVMGSGTVKGAGSGTGTGGAFDLLGGNLTLCGGTYMTTGASPIIGTRGVAGVPKATINIYKGTTIQGATTNTVSNLYLVGETEVNMYEGLITGGTATTVNGGNVYMGDSFTETFNLFGGTITGGTATQGGNFYVGKTGTVNLYAGTVENGTASSQGGNFRVSGGTVKIEAATVTGGTATSNNGGNFFLLGGATLEMEGGSILNGAAPSTEANSGNGGNIYSYGANTVKLSGNATISGGTSKNGGGKNLYCVNVSGVGTTVIMNGGSIESSIYLSSKSTIEVAGTATVGKANGGLYLSKGTLVTLGALTEGAEIYVTLEDAEAPFTVENPNAATYAAFFKATAAARRVIAKDNALYITTASEEAVMMTEVDKVFDAGNNVEAMCPVCQKSVTWMPLTGATTLNTTTFATGNHFYLASDVNLEASGSIKTDPTIAKACLHLNGKTYAQKATITNAIGSVWVVADTELNIMGNGTVSGAGYKVSDTRFLGGAIDARGTVNIYGGTYMSTSTEGRPAVATMNTGVVNMYAGTITRSTGLTVSNASSSNVMLDTAADTKFNMYGGIIENGSALKGGNVYMTRGEFTMEGGTIQNGVATGTTANSGHGGGNIHISGGVFTLNGGTITGGNATLQGGNVRVDAGKFVMEDGIVSYGTAANLGGNFRFGGSATTAEIKGGQVLGGYVGSSGGSIGVVGANVTISGGTIDGSGITQQANATSGGLIYINSGNVEVTGTAVLKNGKSSGSGNGIYVGANMTLTVSGGNIQNTVHLNATGNIALSGAAKISDVNINGGAKLTLGALTEGAEIFVTAPAGAVVAELASDPTAYLTYVKSAVSTLTIAVDGNNLKAVAA